jgi:hypothetical protein
VSEAPPDDVTTNITDNTATSGQQTPTGESMSDQSMVDASQAEIEAQSKRKQKQEDEQMRIMRWEGGIVLEWAEE